jgi:hypothetical protein
MILLWLFVLSSSLILVSYHELKMELTNAEEFCFLLFPFLLSAGVLVASISLSCDSWKLFSTLSDFQ